MCQSSSNPIAMCLNLLQQISSPIKFKACGCHTSFNLNLNDIGVINSDENVPYLNISANTLYFLHLSLRGICFVHGLENFPMHLMHCTDASLNETELSLTSLSLEVNP